MNRTVAIAARELADRRIIFITAAVLAALPFAILLLPGVARYGAPTVIAITGGVVAGAFVTGLALVLGSTFIGRELADKRLSFYFSKPLSGASLWFGKLSAAVVTLLVSLAIIFGPSLLVAGPRIARLWLGDIPAVLGGFTMFVIWLLLMSHAASTMVRSRSMLMIVDLAAALLIAGAVYTIVRALLRGHAMGLVNAFAWVFTAVLLAALAGGGAWQLSRGRVDVRRNHRELSKFVWATLGATLLVAGLATAWIGAVSAKDLYGMSGEQSVASKWVLVNGLAKNRGDYRAAFFVNSENGTAVRADASSLRWVMAFSRDGRSALQINRNTIGTAGQLELIRFGEREVTTTPTHLTVPPRATVILNDAGTRSAVVANDTLTVDSLSDRRLLASVRMPVSGAEARMFFVNDDVIRLYARQRLPPLTQRVDIFEFDIPSRRLTRTGGFEESARGMYFNASADGSRLLVRGIGRDRSAPGALRVCDGRTGAVLAEVGASAGRSLFGTILQDGRIAAVTMHDAARTLSLYNTAGGVDREIALPGISQVPVFRELTGGKLLVGGRRDGKWRTYIVDLKSGATSAAPAGVSLRPVEPDFFNYHETDPRNVPAPGDRVTLLGQDTLVVWSPGTGETRALIGEL